MRIWLVVAVLVSVSLGYGEPFKAVPVKGAVTIDGSLADWWASGPEPVWMGRAEQVKKSEWGGLRDAGGAAFFLYDSKSLYFGAVVYDDRHLQTRVRDSFWLGDSVQVALDVLGNATVPGYRDENREIGFALTPEGPKCECTYMGRLMSAADAASIRTAVRREEEGGRTVYEAAIPFTALKPYSAGSGRPMAACVVFNDEDGAGRGYLETGPGVTLSKDPMTFTPLTFEPVTGPVGVRVFGTVPSSVSDKAISLGVDVMLFNPGPGAGECTVRAKIGSTVGEKSQRIDTGIGRVVVGVPLEKISLGLINVTVSVQAAGGKELGTCTFEGTVGRTGQAFELGHLPQLLTRAKILAVKAKAAQEAGWHVPRAKVAPAVVEWFVPLIQSDFGRASENQARVLKMGQQLEWLVRQGEEEAAMALDDARRPAHWPKSRAMADPRKARMRDNVLMSEGRPVYVVGTSGEGAAISEANYLSAMGFNGLAVWMSPGAEWGGDSFPPFNASMPPKHDKMLPDVNGPLSPAGEYVVRRFLRAGVENRIGVTMHLTVGGNWPGREADPRKMRVCGMPQNELCCLDPFILSQVEKALNAFVDCAVRDPNAGAYFTWALHNEVAMREQCTKAVAKFRTELKQRYGTIETLNKTWRKAFGRFDEIGIPDKPEPCRALWYEWWTFHDRICTDYLLWTADVIRRRDPDKTRIVQIKTDQNIYHVNDYSSGVNRERIALATDLSGGDADTHHLAVKLDTHRALGRGKPFFNSEFHVVYNLDQDHGPDRVYAYHWQGAIHGQQGALSWHWHHGEWDASIVNNTRFRPNACYMIGRASLDLNRFAEEIAALAKVEGSVAVCYSRASVIQSPDPYVYDVVKLHEALMGFGLVVEVLTERQLAEGVPGRFKAVVFPQGTCLPESSFKGVCAFGAGGGKVVVCGDALTRDCLYRPNTELASVKNRLFLRPERNEKAFRAVLAAILKQAGVRVPLIRTTEGAGNAVEFRAGWCGGRSIAYLCNMSSLPASARVHSGKFSAVDLLNGKAVGRMIALPPWQPMLLEISGVEPETMTLTVGLEGSSQ